MKEMYSKIITMTPEMAERFLQTNPRNRHIKREKVKKLIDDIKHGEWKLTHQGIAIDEDGKLIDGHHRLTAIVETGIPCEMMVTFNAVESEKIDIGATRNDKDALYMAGIIDKGSIEYNHLTYPLIGFIIDRNFKTNKSKETTATSKHLVYLKLKDIIDPIVKVADVASKGRTRSAPILYAMCCAMQGGVDLETIKRWHKITWTGDFYAEGDDLMTRAGRSVMLFKDFADIKQRIDSLSEKETMVKKAESSIRHFAEKRPITKLYGEIVYPEIIVKEEDLRDGGRDKK